MEAHRYTIIYLAWEENLDLLWKPEHSARKNYLYKPYDYVGFIAHSFWSNCPLNNGYSVCSGTFWVQLKKWLITSIKRLSNFRSKSTFSDNYMQLYFQSLDFQNYNLLDDFRFLSFLFPLSFWCVYQLFCHIPVLIYEPRGTYTHT